VFCDNDAVVAGINKRTIRGAAIRPLQSLFLLAAQRNIDVVAVWVPSKANALADALSRFDLKKITNLVGQQTNFVLRRQPSMIMLKTSRLMQLSTSTTALPHRHEQRTSRQSIYTQSFVRKSNTDLRSRSLNARWHTSLPMKHPSAKPPT
jgi:hypothetical protein